MTSQLELVGVSVSYGAFTAVAEVSLGLQQGEIGCLLGPSGCGKTTLLRAIAGFEPVTAGEIRLRGNLISHAGSGLPPERRNVGMVFQDFALFPHLDVRRNIEFGLGGLESDARRQRVEQMLHLVDLAREVDRFPHELSGGQQQRVALARALAPEPDILLLDEPFSSLDSELREQLASEVRDLLKASGVTAVLVTHDQHEAFAMADRIAVMQHGRVEQWDTPYKLFYHPASPQVAGFLGEGFVIRVTRGKDQALEQALGLPGNAWPSLAAGESFGLLVRPGDVEVASGEGLALSVVRRTFRGSETAYELELNDGQRISCRAPGDVNVPVGETLCIRFDFREPVVFMESDR